MAKEICISSTPHETRLAILEDDQLSEIYYERENEYTLAGSIYNGRVTRVLPGMQSAFVDLGLERDAFLYVTDFLELEDPEESDEIEKAAVTGGIKPPREIRRRAAEESPVAEPVVEAAAPSESDEQTGEESAEGGRRWRGRRRRRGGRGGATPVSDPVETEETSETYLETRTVQESARESDDSSHQIHASAGEHRTPASRQTGREQAGRGQVEPERTPRAAAASTAAPFVLPGESLSKYGGEPAPTAKAEKPAAPARPLTTSKPSTLIESPLEWDGSGLLPGESLSRHRNRPAPAEEAEATPEPAEVVAEAPAMVHEIAEPEAEPETAAEAHVEPADEPHTAFEFTEEEVSFEEQERSASHNIDPLPPSEFRLFGLGGKKKKDSEPEFAPEPEQRAEVAATTVRAVSAYAPGNGLVEEEVIDEAEGETEIGAPRKHAHHTEGDLEEYEETEQLRAHAGELMTAFKDARLGNSLDIDEVADEEEDDEEAGEEAAAPAAPATRERRDRGDRSGDRGDRSGDRGGRGRRGRQGQGDNGRNNRRNGGMSRRSAQTSDLPIISDLLKPGQEILVQIAKEPIAKKGARITSHIALPGRFLVFMPTVSHVGVSRKIESDEERQRLKRILLSERGEASGGFIVRTAAEGMSEEELRNDLRFLLHLWDEIKQRSEASKSPALIYHDLSLIERILRDQVSDNFSSIWVDNEAAYERIVRFLNRFSPTLVRRVKLYTKEVPLFEHFGIEEEISKALRSKVWLKSGGSIVINQTEALVAIDINTGKYVGKTARLEDTIVKTNLDAIPEIVRQIRLRDLGGIIIIDFIDMDERKNRFKVMAALEEALKTDRAPTKVLQFNDFGLVAITRKRVKQSLERTLSVPCPTCQATGMVKSPATVANEIYIELRKMRKHFENADVMLRVHPETVKVLKASNARWLTEFEELVGKNILVKSDATLHPEQFDIQG